MSSRRRALVLYGGWSGHQPERMVEVARRLLASFEVVCSPDLGLLRDEVLADFDLLLPIWSMGELPEAGEQALLRAVQRGLGLVAWHAAASAFRATRRYKLLLGGQFVDHPGGEAVSYEVTFRSQHELVAELPPFSVRSEQYYLLVDPAVTVLATTRIVAEQQPWLRGVEMPVCWLRSWGAGRVFYCSVGHSPALLETEPLRTLLVRAAAWASSSGEPRSR